MPLGLALLLAAGLAAVALAAGPVKGATYSGTLTVSSGETVTFKVNKSGTQVSAIRVKPFLPNRCGAGGPPPQETSESGPIKNKRFTATVSQLSTDGTVSATAKVTGSFLPGGKVKGSVKSDLPTAEECNGSFAYTAKAIKH